MNDKSIIGVVGSGTMGIGIAQIAAQNEHRVLICDTNENALLKAKANLASTFHKLVEKGKMSAETAEEIQMRIDYSREMADFSNCSLVIEAIVENLEVKKKVFANLEELVSDTCVLATNTSSISIASISAALSKPERFLGIHFFNPAPLMPLVEIIPSFITDDNITSEVKALVDSWGKTTVLAKDTPGFIVNRVARPYYSEAMKMYEEGVANFATIDWALKTIGGFKMGPFELMDYIGHDVNYVVTETVFTQFYFDPRFKPALCQKRLVEAGFFGKKSGRGFYNYAENAKNPDIVKDEVLGRYIFERTLVMLMNEAIDALFMQVATRDDIDMAMTKGVNYPKGLLKWADEFGLDLLLRKLEFLQNEFGDDRYRPNPLLRRKVKEGKNFY